MAAKTAAIGSPRRARGIVEEFHMAVLVTMIVGCIGVWIGMEAQDRIMRHHLCMLADKMSAAHDAHVERLAEGFRSVIAQHEADCRTRVAEADPTVCDATVRRYASD